MGLESLGGAQSEAASEWLRAFDHARFRNPFSLWCSCGVSQEYRKFLRWPIVRTCKLSKPRTASGRSQDAEQPRENAPGCQRLGQACKCIKQICIKSVTRVFSKSKSWSAVTPGKWRKHGEEVMTSGSCSVDSRLGSSKAWTISRETVYLIASTLHDSGWGPAPHPIGVQEKRKTEEA